MPPITTERLFDSFRHWARNQFHTYRGCIGYVESKNSDGDIGVGTCFHVGDGVFVTARHVIEGRQEIRIDFDDNSVAMTLIQDSARSSLERPGDVHIIEGPYFHAEEKVDVACFRLDFIPEAWIPLGGHLEDYLGQYDLILNRTLVLGHPPVPRSDRPVLVASLGEINALVTRYDAKYIHFIVSSTARGGFSGGPVLIAYNELNEKSGTALLGLVTDSLVRGEVDTESGYMAVLSVDPIYQCLQTNNMLSAAQAASLGE